MAGLAEGRVDAYARNGDTLRMDTLANHPTETLTDAGYAWAWENVSTSFDARVALFGATAWPSDHVNAAVRTCNQAAKA